MTGVEIMMEMCIAADCDGTVAAVYSEARQSVERFAVEILVTP